MRKKLSNQFLKNYLLLFFLVIFATWLAFYMLSLTSGFIASSLTKNRYPASSIIKDDYTQINPSSITSNGGGVQVIDKDYRIVLTSGLDTFGKANLSKEEFTNFLINSKEGSYHYDILYSQEGEFWLIVTFPTSIRLDFALVFNKNASPNDFTTTITVIVIVFMIYALFLAIFTFILSKITASSITKPLRKLSEGTRLLREGDYSVRVDLKLKNEFAELQDTFNDMAARIEYEMDLRKKVEDNRRRLILDVSHDLKNPLASVLGYAELCLKNPDLSPSEKQTHLQIIYNNSKRANMLLNELFELSQLDSPDFVLKLEKTDLCEYVRQVCGELLPLLDQAGFHYEFDIPEEPIDAMIDSKRLMRIFQNLMDNAIRYNTKGTTFSVQLKHEENQAIIFVRNDGTSIPTQLAEEIFKPFVRATPSQKAPGGSGLGLAIAKKIAIAHGGDLTLSSNEDKNCAFKIIIPTI